ncbi:MAG: formate dehydrogenase accessory sulfurtransferase FdhD, partial [Dehalococcoidales bacterium]|nr:formate dehydrogenase accessory sulfurtransferase FdhD [Dehalococcoidales bacterium]
MTDGKEKLPIECLSAQDRQAAEDLVVRELGLTIILDGEELTTLRCSPAELEYLALGFLFSEGLVGGRDEVKGIAVD